MKKVLFLVFCISFISSIAFANEYSSVVAVDIYDVSASSAKEKAWSSANRIAINNVMQKISNNVSLDYLSDAQILNLVKETQVISEKNSDVRYIGELNVVFNKASLDKYLQEKNIKTLDIYTSKVLAIPLYREFKSDTPMLWEQGNKLKQAFEKSKVKGLVAIEPIVSSADNYATLDVAKVISLDISTLEKVAEKNGIDDIFIIDCANDGIDGLIINISYYKSGDVKTSVIKVGGDISSDEIFDEAIAQISQFVDNQIKQNSANFDNSAQSVDAIFNFDDMRQWLLVQKKLKEIGYIKKVDMIAMQSNKVQLKIEYVGDLEKLLYAMRAKFLNLRKERDFYVLERV